MTDKTFFERYSDFAEKELRGELKALSTYKDRLFKPYRGFGEHCIQTVLYPIYHNFTLLVHLTSAVVGCCLFIGAIFSTPSKSVPEVFFGILKSVAALALNIVNLLASVLSIPCRTIATFVNLGYGDLDETPEKTGSRVPEIEPPANSTIV